MESVNIVTASQLLGVCRQRVQQLIYANRVKGAFKTDKGWQIPLYDKMPCIIPAKRGMKGTWRTRLIQDFGLQLTEDEQFFREWQDDLPKLSNFQQRQLDQLKAGYLNLQNYDAIAENIVKMTVLDPLLFIGEFYLNPFCLTAEKPIDLISEDEEVTTKGRIDTLILADRLWLMVIEATKSSTYSLETGLPQILAYMMGNTHPDLPSYGMITTGSEFIFLKLIRHFSPQYATSNVFNLDNRGNDLYKVLKIMKKLNNLILTK